MKRAGERLPAAAGTFWVSAWAAGPILPMLEAGCWVMHSRSCKALLIFAVMGM